MKSFDDEKIRNVLAAAYEENVSAEIGDGWQAETMRRIRYIGPLNPKVIEWPVFEQFIWRFAVTACMLALILSVYVLQSGGQPEYELAQLFISDPLGFGLVQSFDIL